MFSAWTRIAVHTPAEADHWAPGERLLPHAVLAGEDLLAPCAPMGALSTATLYALLNKGHRNIIVVSNSRLKNYSYTEKLTNKIKHTFRTAKPVSSRIRQISTTVI